MPRPTTIERTPKMPRFEGEYDPYCVHGIYVGGSGADYMCSRCEQGGMYRLIECGKCKTRLWVNDTEFIQDCQPNPRRIEKARALWQHRKQYIAEGRYDMETCRLLQMMANQITNGDIRRAGLAPRIHELMNRNWITVCPVAGGYEPAWHEEYGEGADHRRMVMTFSSPKDAAEFLAHEREDRHAEGMEDCGDEVADAWILADQTIEIIGDTLETEELLK